MKNKRYLLLLFFLICLSHFIVSQNLTYNEKTVWNNITEISQLNGIWKGNINLTESGRGITVKAETDLTLTINSATNVIFENIKINMEFSGFLIFTLWKTIKKGFEDIPEFNTVINDSAKTVTLTRNKLFNKDEIEKLKNSTVISQNGKEIELNSAEYQMRLFKL
jgi:hypothetical protein